MNFATLLVSFNRTILELKYFKVEAMKLFKKAFQSHHTGIEITIIHELCHATGFFQSHHTGIEIAVVPQHLAALPLSIAPYWN